MLKLETEYIDKDPHETPENGRILLDIIDRQNLIIGNGSVICKGVITRERITSEVTEKSVIDYIITCEELFTAMEEMTIDDNSVHKLIRYRKDNGTNVKVTSDHNILHAKF